MIPQNIFAQRFGGWGGDPIVGGQMQAQPQPMPMPVSNIRMGGEMPMNRFAGMMPPQAMPPQMPQQLPAQMPAYSNALRARMMM